MEKKSFEKLWAERDKLADKLTKEENKFKFFLHIFQKSATIDKGKVVIEPYSSRQYGAYKTITDCKKVISIVNADFWEIRDNRYNTIEKSKALIKYENRENEKSQKNIEQMKQKAKRINSLPNCIFWLKR